MLVLFLGAQWGARSLAQDPPPGTGGATIGVGPGSGSGVGPVGGTSAPSSGGSGSGSGGGSAGGSGATSPGGGAGSGSGSGSNSGSGSASAPEARDPRAWQVAAEHARSAGRLDEAGELFGRMIDAEEVSLYLKIPSRLRDALVAERLGDSSRAASLYRETMTDDVLRVVQVLRILSVHPAREALVAEALSHVRALADTARQGGEAMIYRTKAGEPRDLKVMTTADVLAKNAKDEQVEYCLVDHLDLTHAVSLPDKVNLTRCVIGKISASDVAFQRLVVDKTFVLGDANLGKTWDGEVNKSKTLPPSTFRDLYFRESVFLGEANFWGVEVDEGRAYFPLVDFEGPANFRGAELGGITDFRFSSFGADATFRNMRMHAPVYLGGTRFREDVTFTGLYSERNVWFNGATFEGEVAIDGGELLRDVTFEDSHFAKKADLRAMRVAGSLNLSRATFDEDVSVTHLHTTNLDALGATFEGDAWFTDATVLARTRFAVDGPTREAVSTGRVSLLPLYRWYQGDEDSDAPLATGASYGVTGADDLTARFDGSVSFANSVFHGYTVFEGAEFGVDGEASLASFYNAQFLGETHFEGTRWHGVADFATIFGYELSWNNAEFHGAFLLDDANVRGRVSLADATFAAGSTVSFHDAGIDSLGIDPWQLIAPDGGHNLFHERCLSGQISPDDLRLTRMQTEGPLSADALRDACYTAIADEYTQLRSAYADRVMGLEADDMYWWLKHHDNQRRMRYGTLTERAFASVVGLLLFEMAFGWGVRLGNLALTSIWVILAFAVTYRVACPDDPIQWAGDRSTLREAGWLPAIMMSFQSFLAANYGWDIDSASRRMQALVTAEMYVGVLIMTFFVGAYTRQILQ
jgi:hypothetical protein